MSSSRVNKGVKIPLYSQAVLIRPYDDLKVGQVVIVVDYIKSPKPELGPGYVVEVGPWGDFGAPADWTVVPESCLAPTP